MRINAQLGSISTGTLNPDDTIAAMLDELLRLTNGEPTDSERETMETAAGWLDRDDSEREDEEDMRIESDLMDALTALAPDYAYFGAHPSDGADLGFWLYDDWQTIAREDGVLEVADTGDIPADHEGLVLHINDHGNATLYLKERATDSTYRELWSVV